MVACSLQTQLLLALLGSLAADAADTLTQTSAWRSLRVEDMFHMQKNAFS